MLFADFHERDTDLAAVVRYDLYPTMFYRTNLLIHSKRVAWIVDEINPHAKDVFGTAYDAQRAIILALVHDDAELIMGDVKQVIRVI